MTTATPSPGKAPGLPHDVMTLLSDAEHTLRLLRAAIFIAEDPPTDVRDAGLDAVLRTMEDPLSRICKTLESYE